MSVLGIFVIEILFHIYSYGTLFLKDCWNIADMIVIALSIAFVLLDLLIQSQSALKNFLKLRGIFRLLRVFILIRKLNIVRIRREVSKRSKSNLGYDIRSPLEKVLEILGDIRDVIDPSQDKMITDLNYCIKMISSNKLYEAELDMDDPDDDKSSVADLPDKSST